MLVPPSAASHSPCFVHTPSPSQLQNDIHFGELTVRETLDFAARCQASRTRKREWACLLLQVRTGWFELAWLPGSSQQLAAQSWPSHCCVLPCAAGRVHCFTAWSQPIHCRLLFHRLCSCGGAA